MILKKCKQSIAKEKKQNQNYLFKPSFLLAKRQSLLYKIIVRQENSGGCYTMNEYLKKVLEEVEEKNKHESEYLQAVNVKISDTKNLIIK